MPQCQPAQVLAKPQHRMKSTHLHHARRRARVVGILHHRNATRAALLTRAWKCRARSIRGALDNSGSQMGCHDAHATPAQNALSHSMISYRSLDGVRAPTQSCAVPTKKKQLVEKSNHSPGRGRRLQAWYTAPRRRTTHPPARPRTANGSRRLIDVQGAVQGGPGSAPS